MGTAEEGVPRAHASQAGDPNAPLEPGVLRVAGLGAAVEHSSSKEVLRTWPKGIGVVKLRFSSETPGMKTWQGVFLGFGNGLPGGEEFSLTGESIVRPRFPALFAFSLVFIAAR